MSQAQVYKQGKLRTQLLPADALIEVAKAFEQGAVKHGARNWEIDGKHYTDVYGALQRHAFDWFDGKNTDDESGLDPMAHICACALMLLAMRKRGIGKDDRLVHKQLEMPLQNKLDKAFEEIEEQNREAAESIISREPNQWWQNAGALPLKTSLRCVHCANDAMPGKELCADCFAPVAPAKSCT